MVQYEKLGHAALAMLLWCACLACSTSSHSPETTQAELIVSGATLIDGTGAPPQAETSIIVRDGRVDAVIPDSDAEGLAAETVIDATGKFLIPGLADMHVHFGLGAPVSRKPETTDVVLARELYYGVTAILMLGGTDGSTDSIRALRDRRARGELKSPHIYGTGGHLTLHGTHPIYTIFPPGVREATDSLAADTPMSEP
ncbi:MAG: hypothetical protein OEV00_15505, partial [Acidobacteriota bacterium]|nr:hypothetical protein [Acidobacteriota bacterium]